MSAGEGSGLRESLGESVRELVQPHAEESFVHRHRRSVGGSATALRRVLGIGAHDASLGAS